MAVTSLRGRQVSDGDLTDADFASANKDGSAGTYSLRTLGTGASQAAAGNHTHTKSDIGLGNVDNTSNATERAATATLANKRITKRVTSIASSATPTINTDNCDRVKITALATAITSMTTNLSGTPSDFDTLEFRIKDDGTARAITWGSSFENMGAALPTTTVAGKRITVGLEWDSVTSKWGCVAVATEA